MARGTFTGGVHPYDGKDLSRHMPIKTVYPRGIVVFPLLQHMGAPAIPCVKVGDPVLTGQMIAKADGDFSANIHS
ncbi:MAG: electron transporter RnfC, partial [Clostridiales bacterium]|nr:electron transporter RnfC [Clostridiales bacterium]